MSMRDCRRLPKPILEIAFVSSCWLLEQRYWMFLKGGVA